MILICWRKRRLFQFVENTNFSDLTSCGQMMTAAGQYYRSSAAAAAQMRSVYNPAGEGFFKSFKDSFQMTADYLGMPGAGSQYSVMGRPQDPRSSMFGSSINLNGKYQLWCFGHFLPFQNWHLLFLAARSSNYVPLKAI